MSTVAFGVMVGAATAASAAANPVRLDHAVQLPIPYAHNVINGPAIGNSFQNPCWGPGSNQIVFTQYTQSYNIGSSVTRIANFPGGQLAALLSPLPSPSNPLDAVNEPGACWNGRTHLIAYSGSDALGTDQIVVVRPDGTGSRFVTGSLDSKLSAWEPSISPDGSWIVFEAHPCIGNCASRDPNNPPNYSNNGAIAKIRSNGTGLTYLTCGHADQQPNWAPTNQNLVVFQRDNSTGSDLYTFNPNVAQACATRQLTSMTAGTTTGGQSSDASFSPDSLQIVYSGSTPTMPNGQASIFLLDVARDAPPQEVTFTRNIYDGAPSYSPDGSTIAFESCPANPTFATCPANSDTSPGTRIWTIAAP